MVKTKKSNTNKQLINMNFKEIIIKNEYKNHITELESQNLQIPRIQTTDKQPKFVDKYCKYHEKSSRNTMGLINNTQRHNNQHITYLSSY